ncbi:hypothetical protein B9Z55_025264 [Caenorhabditis nigoni]|uniref:Uncharacterized protein n=1 Tax=Caenorhabditis nigoni TaxID=1611254 RepID=A0A2G5SXP9_9PELO|nr:hypothetical protein B9Z55_025264 [Caenorhabditis nigoni]
MSKPTTSSAIFIRKKNSLLNFHRGYGAGKLAGQEMDSSCSKEILGKLIDILQEHLPHTKSFKMMYEVEKEEKKKKTAVENRPKRNVTMVFQIRSQVDQRRYQNSSAKEVSVVCVGDDDALNKRNYRIPTRRSSQSSSHP